MRRGLCAAAFCTLVIAGFMPVSASAGPVGRYIVVLNEGVSRPAAVANEHARRYGHSVSHVYSHAIKGYAAQIPEGRLDDVANDPRVAYLSVDAEVHALAQTVPTGVGRTFASTNPNVGIDGVDDERVDADIAILDTGIDLGHPDLNVAGGKNCQTGNTFDDGNGHGTHVAGTAAALDDGNGVVGMAPGARLWAVRVLSNSGSGSWSAVLCGIDWVTGRNTDGSTSNDIEVANMSLSGSGSDGSCSSSALHDGICKSVDAGVTYVVAAGNNAANAAGQVPAAYDQVVTVSALADFNGLAGGGGAATCRSDVDDTFANFSNYGADVDLIAPGVCIDSTWKDGGRRTISGTSMASPHVAGAAALYKSGHPTATPTQVRSALQTAGNLNWNSADDKDATKERLLDVSDTTVFSPAMLTTGSPSDPPSNATPSASNDSVTTDREASVDVTLNGSDAETCELAFTIVVPPSNGSLGSLVGAACSGAAGAYSDSATVSYTPDSGYSGADSFTFKVNDGTTDSAAATVSITVDALPSPPGAFSLSATGYKVKGWQNVDLSWSPAGTVEVYRDGTLTAVVTGSTYTDASIAKGGGTYSYVVCITGTSDCSNSATVDF